jgi:hypothetical protein
MSAACHCTANYVSAIIPNEWGLKTPSVRYNMKKGLRLPRNLTYNPQVSGVNSYRLQ